MNLGDLFLARRAILFLRGHDERRQRGRRAERALVGFLFAICAVQFIMLVIAVAV